MKILNLGCGTKISPHPDIINIDWSIYLRIKNNILLKNIIPLFLTGERLNRFRSLPTNIMVYNIAKNLPFDSDSIDVVYHSHLLEHLDKETARNFLLEIKRVLKPGGVLRTVVPDWEKSCKKYIAHISLCETNPREARKHDEYVSQMIEQSVRREPFGTSQQLPLRRRVENLLLGDARQRGETHQWAYDRINLVCLLMELGFKNPFVQKFNTSFINEWNQYRLDLQDNGEEYKTDSLYVEVVK